MSEFQEVMKQWRRMCVWHAENEAVLKEGCGVACPLGHNPVCGELEGATDEQIACAEREIMKWAKEHPEPVYPTWMEWLVSIGVVRREEYPNVDGAARYYTEGMYFAIPADTAKKYGIEPKEGA